MNFNSNIIVAVPSEREIVTCDTQHKSLDDFPPVDDLFLQSESISAVQMLLEHDNKCNPDDVDIDHIQLYLECADDTESILSNSFQHSPFYSGLSTATSQIKSDLQFRVSFPSVAQDSMKLCKCPLCKKMFCGKNVLRDHVSLEHENSYFFCQCCTYFTKSFKWFKTHMKTRHDIHIIEEDNILTTVEDLHQNEGAANSTDNDILTAYSNTTDGLVEETTVLGDNSVALTEECIEIQSEKKTSLFTCGKCPYTTSSQRLLGYHCKTMHNDNRRLFKCNQCNYQCKQQRTFEAHKRKHQGRFDFVCDLCSKKFASKHLLTKHTRIHKKTVRYEVPGKHNSENCEVTGENSTDCDPLEEAINDNFSHDCNRVDIGTQTKLVSSRKKRS